VAAGRPATGLRAVVHVNGMAELAAGLAVRLIGGGGDDGAVVTRIGVAPGDRRPRPAGFGGPPNRRPRRRADAPGERRPPPGAAPGRGRGRGRRGGPPLVFESPPPPAQAASATQASAAATMRNPAMSPAAIPKPPAADKPKQSGKSETRRRTTEDRGRTLGGAI